MQIFKRLTGRWHIRRQSLLTLASLILIVGHVIAQNTCPTLVESALEALDDECGDLARNQACYGNVSLEVTPQPNVSDFHFEKVGDIANVVDIQALKLEPLDADEGTWGVVMMQLQADIPDTLPGQNVTFVLFGNVEIENTATEDQTPMQAFTIQTGMSDAGCDEAPESGVMIQTPDGVESVAFNVNGVDMEIGSTVMLQAEAEGDMIVSTMEGAAVMEMDGQSYSVIAGTEMSIPMGADMRPNGVPLMPIALETARMGSGAMMPSLMLPRPMDVIEPIDDEGMAMLEQRMEEGLPPCGVDGLPACEHALRIDDARVWANKDAFGVIDGVLPGGRDLPNLTDLPGLPGGRDGDDQETDETPSSDGGSGRPIGTRVPGGRGNDQETDESEDQATPIPDRTRPAAVVTPEGSGSRPGGTGTGTDGSTGEKTPIFERTRTVEVTPDGSGSRPGGTGTGAKDQGQSDPVVQATPTKPERSVIVQPTPEGSAPREGGQEGGGEPPAQPGGEGGGGEGRPERP